MEIPSISFSCCSACLLPSFTLRLANLYEVKCEGDSKALQALLVLIPSLFPSSKSVTSLHLSLSSLTLSTSLHTLFTIFNTPRVSNMLWTVRFPFTVIMVYKMYTNFMVHQSYFTVCTHDVQGVCGLLPRVGLIQACPNNIVYYALLVILSNLCAIIYQFSGTL